MGRVHGAETHSCPNLHSQRDRDAHTGTRRHLSWVNTARVLVVRKSRDEPASRAVLLCFHTFIVGVILQLAYSGCNIQATSVTTRGRWPVPAPVTAQEGLPLALSALDLALRWWDEGAQTHSACPESRIRRRGLQMCYLCCFSSSSTLRLSAWEGRGEWRCQR